MRDTHTVPLEVKRLRGNPGKRSLPDIKETVPLRAVTEVPEPPSSFGPVARQVWEFVWSNCNAWVAEIDTLVLTRYCELYDRRAELMASIDGYGMMVEGVNNTQKLNPAVNALTRLEAQMLAMEAKLYLNPADRARGGLAEIKKMSALEELMAGNTKASRKRVGG